MTIRFFLVHLTILMGRLEKFNKNKINLLAVRSNICGININKKERNIKVIFSSLFSLKIQQTIKKTPGCKYRIEFYHITKKKTLL